MVQKLKYIRGGPGNDALTGGAACNPPALRPIRTYRLSSVVYRPWRPIDPA